jgi:hypothetical protein
MEIATFGELMPLPDQPITKIGHERTISRVTESLRGALTQPSQ